MEKLTGNGRPSNHTVGVVGQHYEDLLTGDIYECRIASQYSKLHGSPVGGYVWEFRAKGEDIADGLYGSGSGSGSSSSGIHIVKASGATMTHDGNIEELIAALKRYEPVIVMLDRGNGMIETMWAHDNSTSDTPLLLCDYIHSQVLWQGRLKTNGSFELKNVGVVSINTPVIT